MLARFDQSASCGILTTGPAPIAWARAATPNQRRSLAWDDSKDCAPSQKVLHDFSGDCLAPLVSTNGCQKSSVRAHQIESGAMIDRIGARSVIIDDHSSCEVERARHRGGLVRRSS